MKRFIAIEGLRGWLAWAVVFSHLTQTSGIYAKGFGPAPGDFAVLVFIIISGFVIAHLVIERPEPYGTYLVRRLMRIFPVFAVTCLIGYFTYDIHALALSRVPWKTDESVANIIRLARSNHEFFWAHVLAHLTMLHGVISNSVLPFSQYAFSAPAWSLSLEWQFYLVAPLVITLARQPRNLIWLVIGVAALEISYRLHWLGEFQSPSFLPAVAGYFGVGIASRISYPAIAGTLRFPGIIFALLLILVPLTWDAIPILVWVFVLTGLVVNWPDADPLSRAYRFVLESRAATYFGSRSYSVYLCHPALIAICHLLWTDLFPLASRAITFFALSAMVVPLTIITAELLYRSIERPGIALGSWLARRKVEGIATA